MTATASVPIGKSITYLYRPTDPGTYMYHCHFEDVEHVQMGMTGLLYEVAFSKMLGYVFGATAYAVLQLAIGGAVVCATRAVLLRAPAELRPHVNEHPVRETAGLEVALEGRRADRDQFTALLTTTSISLAPGRLNADDSADFNSPGSVIRIDSSPSDFAMPAKSTGGSTKSMPT